jgi:hypothetical protein
MHLVGDLYRCADGPAPGGLGGGVQVDWYDDYEASPEEGVIAIQAWGGIVVAYSKHGEPEYLFDDSGIESHVHRCFAENLRRFNSSIESATLMTIKQDPGMSIHDWLSIVVTVGICVGLFLLYRC